MFLDTGGAFDKGGVLACQSALAASCGDSSRLHFAHVVRFKCAARSSSADHRKRKANHEFIVQRTWICSSKPGPAAFASDAATCESDNF